MQRHANPAQTPSKVPVGVFWDARQCTVPPLYTAEQAIENIHSFLGESFAHQLGPVTIQVYGGEVTISEDTRASLLARDVSVAHADSRDEILLDMCLFALEMPPPACLMLVCSEGDYLPLAKATNRGYWLLVATPRDNAGPEVQDVTERLDWAQVATGTLVDRGTCLRLADLLNQAHDASGNTSQIFDVAEESPESMLWQRIAAALESDMMNPTSGNYRRFCVELLDSNQVDEELASCARDANEWASFVQQSIDAGTLSLRSDGVLLPPDMELWEVFTAVSDPFGSGVWRAAQEYFSSALGRSAVKSSRGKHGVARLLQQAAPEPCRGMPLGKSLHLVKLSLEKKILLLKPDNKIEVAGASPVRTPERSLSRTRSLQQVTPGSHKRPALSKAGSEYKMLPKRSPAATNTVQSATRTGATPDASSRKLKREPSTRSVLSVLIDYPIVLFARLSALLLDHRKEVLINSSPSPQLAASSCTIHIEALTARFTKRYGTTVNAQQLIGTLGKMSGVTMADELLLDGDDITSSSLRVNTAILCEFDYAIRLGICAVLTQPIYESGASLKQLLDDMQLLQRWDIAESRMTAWRAQVMILLTRWTDLVTITGRGTWTEKRVSRGLYFHSNAQKLRLRLKSRLACLVLEFQATHPSSPRVARNGNGHAASTKLTLGQLRDRYKRTYGKKLAATDFNFPSDREMFMEMADICYVNTSKKPQKTSSTPNQMLESHEVVPNCLLESEVVKLQTCYALLETGIYEAVDVDEMAHKLTNRLAKTSLGQITQEHIRMHCGEWLAPSAREHSDHLLDFDREAIGVWPGVAYQPACFPLSHHRVRSTPGPLSLISSSNASATPVAAAPSATLSATNGQQSGTAVPDEEQAAVLVKASNGDHSRSNSNATTEAPARQADAAPQTVTPVRDASSASLEVQHHPALATVVDTSSPIAPHALHFEQFEPVRAALDDLARTQLQKLSDLLSDGSITADQFSKMSVMVLKVAGFTR